MNGWMDGGAMAYESQTMPETGKSKGSMSRMRWNGDMIEIGNNQDHEKTV